MNSKPLLKSASSGNPNSRKMVNDDGIPTRMNLKKFGKDEVDKAPVKENQALEKETSIWPLNARIGTQISLNDGGAEQAPVASATSQNVFSPAVEKSTRLLPLRPPLTKTLPLRPPLLKNKFNVEQAPIKSTNQPDVSLAKSMMTIMHASTSTQKKVPTPVTPAINRTSGFDVASQPEGRIMNTELDRRLQLLCVDLSFVNKQMFQLIEQMEENEMELSECTAYIDRTDKIMEHVVAMINEKDATLQLMVERYEKNFQFCQDKVALKDKELAELTKLMSVLYETHEARALLNDFSD